MSGARSCSRRAILGASTLVFIGCRDEERDAASQSVAANKEGGGGQPSRPIELFSWFGESEALAALIAAHRRQHPEDRIINAGALSREARKTLRERMGRGDPPDSFQANVGEDLMQWVLANRIDARESRLMALDGLLPKLDEFREQLPQELLEQVSYRGKMYAIAANLHRVNELFANARLVERFGGMPKDIPGLLRMGEQAQAAGIPLLALGTKDPWTLSLLAFECVLVAEQGPDFYRAYFGGKLTAADPRLLSSLKTTLRLLRFANPDHAILEWDQGLGLVAEGRAVMSAMGDWARLTMSTRELQPGTDYLERTFPGSESTVVFTSDAFTLPARAKNREAAVRFLATLASPEGQRAVGTDKSSFAARRDVPPSADQPALRERHESMQSGRFVLALSGMAPTRFNDDLNQALAEMVAQNDIEPVVQTLRCRYVLLK